MKTFLALLSIALCLGTTLFYLYTAFRKGTKPHAFTWIIGFFLAAITCAIQFTHGGGTGAWVQAWAAATSAAIALLALRRGDRSYAPSDWAALCLALLTIPLWAATGTPFWSVILLCCIDGAGVYPTYRKSWHAPREEPPLTWLLWGISSLLSAAALDHVSFITAGYPVFYALMNLGLVGVLLFRRRYAAGAGR